nr:unnamed protein product [Callosobruchus chinensis]
MRRFVTYLRNKQNKAILQQPVGAADKQLVDKPEGQLMEFIEHIDETGEFTDLTEIDEVKLERQLRADRISLALDEKRYLEFCKARLRMDTKTGSNPFDHLPGSYYTATMFNGKHQFQEDNPDYSKVHSSQPQITVNEVKEVMRRVHTPQAGKLNFGGPLPETHYLFAL